MKQKIEIEHWRDIKTFGDACKYCKGNNVTQINQFISIYLFCKQIDLAT